VCVGGVNFFCLLAGMMVMVDGVMMFFFGLIFPFCLFIPLADLEKANFDTRQQSVILHNGPPEPYETTSLLPLIPRSSIDTVPPRYPRHMKDRQSPNSIQPRPNPYTSASPTHSTARNGRTMAGNER
jgi:hypothetical protein